MKKILLFFCCLSFFLVSYFSRYQIVSIDKKPSTTKQIEIKGEVKNPGIYILDKNATNQDAIDQAGGLTDKANTDTISLAQKIKSDSVLVIPEKKESVSLISINSASLEELDTLPGIGPAIANRIIEYRNTTPFTSLDQIQEVKGIGEKMFEKIKDLICL